VTAYSPFGHDEFPAQRSAAGRLLQSIADAHGATPRQVALAFLTRRRSVFAIPKAGNPAHAADNAAALALRLSDEEIDAIDQACPLGPEPASLPML
jgi:diketogulonate reductase-like aldo/keto reductase